MKADSDPDFSGERDMIDVTANQGSDGLSITDVMRGLWTFRWSSIAIVAVISTLATIIAFVSTPIYRAEVLLSPLSEDQALGGGLGGIVSQLGDFAPLIGMGGLGGVGLKEETMALVSSRSFLVQFIEEENLMPALYPELVGVAVGELEDIPSKGDAYRLFERSLDVQEDKDSGLIRLTIDWHDPEIAALWANKVVHRINELMRARAIAEAGRSIEYLEKELTKTSILGIQDGIYRLIESHISEIALANSRDGYAFRVIDPAVAPEPKDFIRPQRLLLIAIGLVGASLLSFFVVLVRLNLRHGR